MVELLKYGLYVENSKIWAIESFLVLSLIDAKMNQDIWDDHLKPGLNDKW